MLWYVLYAGIVLYLVAAVINIALTIYAIRLNQQPDEPWLIWAEIWRLPIGGLLWPITTWSTLDVLYITLTIKGQQK